MGPQERAGLPPACPAPPPPSPPVSRTGSQGEGLMAPAPRSSASLAEWRSAPVAPEQVPCDHQPLDLAGAFINLSDACVTVVPLGRHLCHVAHATQDLDGLQRKAGNQGGKGCVRGGTGHSKGPTGEGQRAHIRLLNPGDLTPRYLFMHLEHSPGG